MRPLSLKALSIASLLSLGLCACQTAPKGTEKLDELASAEGLMRVDSKAVDVLYRRPNVDLSGYSKLLIRPVEVQFAKNWNPGGNGSGSALYRMEEADREKIKSELAAAFLDVFQKEMSKGGYPVVSETGADVLEIRAAIVNLYVNAPDPAQNAGQTRVYTTDAGEMTLLLQLHDSVTEQLLARAIDREGAAHQVWSWTTSVSNTADARRIISEWAISLRKALDASRSST